MNHRITLLTGALCLLLFAGFYLWQTPGVIGVGKLTAADIDGYVAVLEKLPVPAPERDSAIARIRAWAANDDGQPIYMLNLMRYYPTLRRYPGAPDFQGTPIQSNDYYESVAKQLLLKTGAYPLIGGHTQGRDVLDASPELDDWSRVLVVRYRNRRAFLDLLTDPAYAPVMPYKLMALSVVLVPVAGDLVIPDARLIVGGTLLAIFLGVGWWRSRATS